MLEKSFKVVSLNPSGITIPLDRMRQLQSGVVDELTESIAQRGQLQPIVVRPKPKGGMGYILIAGWHRLMAIKKLKLDSIRATVLDGLVADEALLAEIDENLMRADLSPAERAMHTDKRKELYEKLHPETRKGAAPGAGRGKKKRSQESQNETFVKDTAKKSKKGRSTVARDATRGKAGRKWLKTITGTSLDQGEEIDALIKLPEKQRSTLIKQARAGKKVTAKTAAKQARRAEREKELGAKQVALPTKKYGLVVCDDAWDYEVWSRETGMDRHAANHYLVEDAHTADEMHKATKDRFKCAADDCLLAMWVTVPHLAIGIDLLRKRGFKYVSHYVWGKNKAGTGHWNRNKHELMLLGVHGKIPCPAPGKQWDSLVMAPVGKHSAKPEKFLAMLEEYFPNLPKIELNRRGKPRPGWNAWGNEAE